jgi:hypothetical protein
MAAFYKRDPNSVVLIVISMEKGLNKFEPLFKKYRRFKPLFSEKLEKEILFKY